MTQVKWFKGIKTEVAAKQRWQKLYKTHHPDLPTGDAVKMQEINSEYQSLISAFVWQKEWVQPKTIKKVKKTPTPAQAQATHVPEQAIVTPPSRLHNEDVEALVDAGVEIGKKLLHLGARFIKRRAAEK